jgi:hypothetical protein
MKDLLHDYTKENSVKLATTLKFKTETIIQTDKTWLRDLYINIPVKKVYTNTEHLMKTSNTDEQSLEQPTK